MDFNDLRADIDLECPQCNRKFQQSETPRKDPSTAECPGCGEAVAVEKVTAEKEP